MLCTEAAVSSLIGSPQKAILRHLKAILSLSESATKASHCTVQL